jgi:hypothetical protein
MAQLVGRADVDNVGVEGFEYQFDSVLRGQQGWRTVLQDGRGRQIGMPGWAAKQPVDGHSIELTIDGDIQSVVCERLRAAVDSLEAVKAIAVVLDPWTGEILAAGSEPQPKTRGADTTNFVPSFSRTVPTNNDGTARVFMTTNRIWKMTRSPNESLRRAFRPRSSTTSADAWPSADGTPCLRWSAKSRTSRLRGSTTCSAVAARLPASTMTRSFGVPIS